MKRKFLHFFALCVIAVSFSGCVYATNGHASIGGEISTGYPSGGYYYERPRGCVGCARPVVVAPARTVIVKESRPQYHYHHKKPAKHHEPRYAYKHPPKQKYGYKDHREYDRPYYPKHR